MSTGLGQIIVAVSSAFCSAILPPICNHGAYSHAVRRWAVWTAYDPDMLRCVASERVNSSVWMNCVGSAHIVLSVDTAHAHKSLLILLRRNFSLSPYLFFYKYINLYDLSYFQSWISSNAFQFIFDPSQTSYSPTRLTYNHPNSPNFVGGKLDPQPFKDQSQRNIRSRSRYSH